MGKEVNMPAFSSPLCPWLHFRGTPRALIDEGARLAWELRQPRDGSGADRSRPKMDRTAGHSMEEVKNVLNGNNPSVKYYSTPGSSK